MIALGRGHDLTQRRRQGVHRATILPRRTGVASGSVIAGCLDEATVLAFLDARLAPADRAQVETHLASCSPCADLTTWTAADIVNRNHESLGQGRPFLDQIAPGARVGQYQI